METLGEVVFITGLATLVTLLMAAAGGGIAVACMYQAVSEWRRWHMDGTAMSLAIAALCVVGAVLSVWVALGFSIYIWEKL